MYLQGLCCLRRRGGVRPCCTLVRRQEDTRTDGDIGVAATTGVEPQVADTIQPVARTKRKERCSAQDGSQVVRTENSTPCGTSDRKSTRLNSSHLGISYAVFC